jgi:hypothetical protein
MFMIKLIASLFLIALLSTTNLNAQIWNGCPDGYQQRQVSFVYEVNGMSCIASSIYCFKCIPELNTVQVVNGPVFLDFNCVIVNGSPIVPDIKDQMINAIIDDIALNSDCNIDPCSSSAKIITFTKSNCYKWTHEAFSSQIILIGCLEYILCIDQWDVCINSDGSVLKTLSSASIQSGPNCAFNVPEGPFSLEESWETECFHNFSCD